MKRWDWEDERPLCKWVDDITCARYKKLKTISLKTANTFGALLYEMDDRDNYRCVNFYSDGMKKVLGASGSVEVSIASGAEFYLNSRGQNALDRTNHFKKVVAMMNALGYQNCRYSYGSNTGSLWFSISTASQATFEKGLSDFDRILRQVFGL
ncbi:MAG: hypothetical protein IKZ28_02445 [Clostridia bacterium]|nr:hypothetical protein [Clostridia bacterium]